MLVASQTRDIDGVGHAQYQRPEPDVGFGTIMPLVHQAMQSITSRRSSQPRTILGFLFGIYSALTAAAVACIIALVGTGSSWLIGFIALYIGITGIGLLIAVMRQASKDPTGLQVGQLTGSEYESIRRLTLGDSSSGERIEILRPGEDVIEGSATDGATHEIKPRAGEPPS